MAYLYSSLFNIIFCESNNKKNKMIVQIIKYEKLTKLVGLFWFMTIQIKHERNNKHYNSNANT